MIKGTKVGLREVRRADIVSFLTWFNDMEFTQYMGRNLPMTEMEEEKWIENLAGDNTRVNFVITAIGFEPATAIGCAGFIMIDHKERIATFGIGIGEKDYWNKGYGTEAAQIMINYGFEQLNFNRIGSNVYDFNPRSQKMHLKVGFKEEGRRRQAKFINGKYCDVIEYGILRSEWESLNSKIENIEIRKP